MSATAQQPGLRSFIVYDRTPEGFVSYPVMTDRHRPHLRAGDFVVIDPRDHDPLPRELFMVQWQGDPQPRLIETWWMDQMECWAIASGAQRYYVNADGETVPAARWGDFGYSAEHLSKRLLGRVVGILASQVPDRLRVSGEAL